jgi:nickel-dependent lactate racemase
MDLVMPAGWRIAELRLRDAAPIAPGGIDQALDSPVGAERLQDLARTRRRAAIAIDDITRPTRTAPILAAVVARLTAAGMPDDAITIVIATGAHRAATADDIRLKVGELAGRVRVISHDPVADVADTGVQLANQPVRVNRAFLAADLRIGIGGVMAHPFAGFSGGGKVVLPGLADLDAVVRSHKYALMGFGGGLQLEGNRFRGDMERAVAQIGIDWTVNVVLNGRCETAALVAGDLTRAHRAAAARAQAIGATRPPDAPLDGLLLNAFPKDSELLQVEAALVPLRGGMSRWLRPGAPIVLLGACPDGLGSHQLFGPGGRLFRPPVAKTYLRDHPLHIVSPAVTSDPERSVFWQGYPYYESWERCVGPLAAALPDRPLVGVAPHGPLHVPDMSGAAPSTEDAVSGNARGARL